MINFQFSLSEESIYFLLNSSQLLSFECFIIYLWLSLLSGKPDKLQQTNDCTQCVPCRLWWDFFFLFYFRKMKSSKPYFGFANTAQQPTTWSLVHTATGWTGERVMWCEIVIANLMDYHNLYHFTHITRNICTENKTHTPIERRQQKTNKTLSVVPNVRMCV